MCTESTCNTDVNIMVAGELKKILFIITDKNLMFSLHTLKTLDCPYSNLLLWEAAVWNECFTFFEDFLQIKPVVKSVSPAYGFDNWFDL